MLMYGQFWNWVVVEGLLLALGAAVIMAFVLKTSVWFESFAANLCLRQPRLPKIKRFFASWFILIGSKVVAMGAILFLFGERVQFDGPFGGVVAFYITIVSIVVFESLLFKKRNKPLPSITN
ncbi:hypothetical protein VIN01S_18230 [Vibrio inusitatus NBRC 102082]|uniref:Uncharacterized protein n=2 Tax=Vibrio inusitatus TaxID=413402 RepID=A0A4Y3HV30_9VIBR|nr:hypothetical protein VIN01S_18230 [Vibrio inusitatus NBRC 102082]